jgi:hypothetical protein
MTSAKGLKTMEPQPQCRPIEASTEPGEANAVEGLVVLDGPGAVAVTLTADAADAMADRLHRAAKEARRS